MCIRSALFLSEYGVFNEMWNVKLIERNGIVQRLCAEAPPGKEGGAIAKWEDFSAHMHEVRLCKEECSSSAAFGPGQQTDDDDDQDAVPVSRSRQFTFEEARKGTPHASDQGNVPAPQKMKDCMLGEQAHLLGQEVVISGCPPVVGRSCVQGMWDGVCVCRRAVCEERKIYK